MLDKELIKQEIERRYNCEKCYPLDREANVAAAVLQELLVFIDSIPEEHNEELYEELDNFLKDPVFGKLINRNAGLALARHFAEWQKQQMKEALQTEYEKGRFDMREEMMKDAVDGYVSLCHDYPRRRSLVAIADGLVNFEYAEKVKIIICKTEKQ